MHLRSTKIAVLLALASTSCAEGFEPHEAFESESYLCGTPAWDDLVSACRDDFEDDGSCEGVASLRGTVEGQNVVIASQLIDGDLQDIRRLDASTDRRGVSMVGLSPYFQFELQVDYIGGDSNEGVVARALTIGVSPDPDLALDDSICEGALRIASGLSSLDRNFASGDVTITYQGTNESAADFHATTFANDEVEGCFVVFDANPELAVETP